MRAGCPNNIHFHKLFLDGVYVEAGGRLRLRRVKAPERAELEALVESLSERVGRHLERQGLLERDAENGYLVLEPEGEDALGRSARRANRRDPARMQARDRGGQGTLRRPAENRASGGPGKRA